jgi:radical SAM protein with 4Fe4S-binding SPASM domain
VDYIVNTTGDRIDAEGARRILADLAAMGNRSVMFCGHGEPLLHPQAADIIAFGSQRMSTSVTTNGLALTGDNVRLVDELEWLRLSINAGTPANYAAVHGVEPERFERALGAVRLAAERKRSLGLGVTIGVQLVLLEENASTAAALARRVRDIGADYFTVKPYSQHPLSENRREVDYTRFGRLREELEALACEGFRVIYRAGSMAKAGAAKPYRTCYGTDFMGFIAANGDVWECNVFAGDPRFLVGNALDEPLPALWQGERRREVLRFIREELDIDSCRDICRLDECNRYLWRLKHPWPHDDFI